ncbi:MAG TPA: tRNA (adenosine(37)-N6)-threonylcarbamoyltransferase complex dimerization subunit type 1 TsaB [Jatrophihabitans sp.]|nr:tRNA (adenosine(37)-N6)-threonylcarbamoyltransferase complex dimerization subunit type 1 TsaB [Jatrophihabitans sp.]
MLVLAIDTSSAAVTAGIVDVSAGSVAPGAEQTVLNAHGHGEYLAPGIAGCLADIGAAPDELSAVVVGTGPGPYTGLRVGLVTAAVLADTLRIPAYGVCSLDAIGNAGADEASLLVATDARRKEVYWARYELGVRVAGPAVSRPADVSLGGFTAVAGAAAELYRDVWPNLRRRLDRYPDPVALVRCALDRIEAGAPSEPTAPLYLRRPDAVVPGAPKAVTQ